MLPDDAAMISDRGHCDFEVRFPEVFRICWTSSLAADRAFRQDRAMYRAFCNCRLSGQILHCALFTEANSGDSKKPKLVRIVF